MRRVLAYSLYWVLVCEGHVQYKKATLKKCIIYNMEVAIDRIH